MKRVTEEEKNLASEKVVGDISLSILNLVRRTRGVVILRRGWTREWRTVGRTRGDGQRYDGRLRNIESVRFGPRVVDVTIDLGSLLATETTLTMLSRNLPRPDEIQRRQDEPRHHSRRPGHA